MPTIRPWGTKWRRRLRPSANLQALTDTAITTLDVDDLLHELLGRLQEILDADTAAVLLLAEGAGELGATAARGLEEEVREGVRIPVGVALPDRLRQIEARFGSIASTPQPS